MDFEERDQPLFPFLLFSSFFLKMGRSPVYRDCYEIEDGTGAARDVHCDVKVTDKAGQAPRPVYLKNE